MIQYIKSKNASKRVCIHRGSLSQKKFTTYSNNKNKKKQIKVYDFHTS